MARHVPVKFRDKLHDVQTVLDIARSEAGRHFDFGREVLPGVRVVRTVVDGHPLAFSLWSYDADVAEICGDGAVPATAALLAIDREQARVLQGAGVFVDLSQFTRSDSTPGLYYALFDLASPKQIHKVLHRLVPSLEPHDDRLLVA
jgi:hypothetical protein